MKTFKIGFIEILSQDVGKMRYKDAIKYCESLGPGWRLPTIREIEFLLSDLSSMSVGGFKKENQELNGYFVHPYYWVQQIDEKYLCWSFIKGDGEYMPENRAFWVRPVKSI